MAPEALWVQQAGVDYAAAEDRHLINSIFTNGVIGDGLVISAGAGLSASVSAGFAAIPDGTGGSYLAYFDAATSVTSLPGSATTTLYVQVNTTTALATIVTGSTPVLPYITLGTVTTSASVVTSVTNPTTRQADARVLINRYLNKYPTTDTTTNINTGGRFNWYGQHDFKNTVRFEQPIAFGVADPTQFPTGIWYTSGSGFTQNIPQDVAGSAGDWTSLEINATGTPNTSTYGNYRFFGDSLNLVDPLHNELIAPSNGIYALSSMIRYNSSLTGLGTGTKVAIRFKNTNGSIALETNPPISQRNQGWFEDHTGNTMHLSHSWHGYCRKGQRIAIQINADITAANLPIDWFEFHWFRIIGYTNFTITAPPTVTI